MSSTSLNLYSSKITHTYSFVVLQYFPSVVLVPKLRYRFYIFQISYFITYNIYSKSAVFSSLPVSMQVVFRHSFE